MIWLLTPWPLTLRRIGSRLRRLGLEVAPPGLVYWMKCTPRPHLVTLRPLAEPPPEGAIKRSASLWAIGRVNIVRHSLRGPQKVQCGFKVGFKVSHENNISEMNLLLFTKVDHWAKRFCNFTTSSSLVEVFCYIAMWFRFFFSDLIFFFFMKSRKFIWEILISRDTLGGGLAPTFSFRTFIRSCNDQAGVKSTWMISNRRYVAWGETMLCFGFELSSYEFKLLYGPGFFWYLHDKY